MKRSVSSLVLVAIAFLGIQNCFEYEETIQFKKGFSGTVEISYEVPLKDDQKSSLIRYLPTQKENIEDKLSQGISKGKLVIRDYNFRLLEKGEFIEPFFENKGRVSYKVDFQDISEIERILPGNMIVKTKGKTVTIRRDFPSLDVNFFESSSVGEKKIISEISKLLKEGSMRFRVIFPTNTECYSNKGSVSLGQVNYVYALSDSLDQNQSKVWEYRLRFF